MNKFTQGLLFGAFVGGLLGLLNTPHSGKENIRRMKEYVDDNTTATGDLSVSLQGLQRSLSSLSEEGMAVVDTATKDLTASIEEFTQKNKPRIKRVSDRVSQLTEDLQKEKEKYESSPLVQDMKEKKEEKEEKENK